MPNASNDSSLISAIDSPTFNIYTYAGLAIFVLGTFGNFCNIIIFIHRRSFLKLVGSWLLLASFFASEFFLLVALFPRVIFSFSAVDPLVLSIIWCKLRYFLGPLSGSTSLVLSYLSTR